jgi:Transposase DDE domain
LASTTAAGLARTFSDGQWAAVETGLGEVHARVLDLLAGVAPDRAQALCDSVTIDMDTTDVEVYGRGKQGVAFNNQGQRVGRPHVAAWPDTATVLAAELGDGRDDPRATCAELLGRPLPAPARTGRIRLRADAGYFAGRLARACLFTGVEFAIGARRTAPLWRILDGLPPDRWIDAIDMTGAQVAVAEYCPNWWPAATRLLIRRVRLDLDRGQVSSDPRARRRRTLHPEQRALPLDELAGVAEVEGVFAYSFIVTNLDVSTAEKAAAVEHWYRHRTSVENLFRDTKHGAGLRHLPSGHRAVNRAWMWGALLAAGLTGWLHTSPPPLATGG